MNYAVLGTGILKVSQIYPTSYDHALFPVSCHIYNELRHFYSMSLQEPIFCSKGGQFMFTYKASLLFWLV